jgi:UPF0755 protein
MKKWILPILGLLAMGALLLYYRLNSPATAFDEESRVLLIPTDSANAAWLLNALTSKGFLSGTNLIKSLSDREGKDGWAKPGRYRIRKGMSQREVFQLLRSGSQEPVKFVVNKFRLREDFARFAGRQLECDSAEVVAILSSPDSLSRYRLDTNNAMTLVIPNTYSIFWNTDANALIRRMAQERDRFWNKERKEKASKLGLTEEQVYALASIVEEETNKHDEKPVIASVYLNRYRKGMPLGADPTIKFAMRDFGLKRILIRHIESTASSPYNTYKNGGIPPGPICTPSIKSIEAVLQPADTEYLFFCAKADFSGYHAFAKDDTEHMRNAKAYQRALDSLMAAKKMD